ncbi:MAG: hypothetical protein Q7S27_03195 [Nanoarchaeota archaeon]|nr:hypothetical protein [Nanoarchaeota archaeon]
MIIDHVNSLGIVHMLDNCYSTAKCFFELIEGFFTKKACISGSWWGYS